MSSTFDRAWWKSAVVYQIYPVSFFDSNGDGLGDLNGITSKLDYLKDLGVDVLWLSPIYSSPMADMGYDISDYRNIDPRYGTLEDWDRLLKGVHDRGMKLVMDLVVNHTSDEHEWFKKSRAGGKINNPMRDWYIWRPPKYDAQGNRQPPNNWKSIFQGSAWEYDEPSDEYYLHLYVTKQPDLNWENPKVREAVWDIMNFWISRGCDGFRMDVINLISKVPGFPDAPITEPAATYQSAFMYYVNGPRVHEYLKQMNTEVLSKHNLMTVGETPFTNDPNQLAPYVLPISKELNMVFQFQLMHIDSPHSSGSDTEPYKNDPLVWTEWKLNEMKTIVETWQTFKRDEGYWNAIFIENHDQPRSVSRFGNDSVEWRTISAQLLAIFQITQTGTLYVYQGEEIGMKNFPRSWPIEEYKDVATINYWNLILEQRKKESDGKEVDMSDVLDNLSKKARDHSRTPIQWDASSHAGFTTGTPWMRVNDDYADSWNASVQAKDEASVLNFWKRALAIRKKHEVLVYGDFRIISFEDQQVFAYTRSLGNTTALVLLNFKETAITFPLDEVKRFDGFKFVLGNHPSEKELPSNSVVLKGYEGKVYIKS
ncbi:glycoside hydrolase family 13 protein [Piloderma croceum F 1598]|uniref:Glycoside hydrolase family 13 protein n=1 Tax=Piloderma croceum (strain F 1598) TaxID=765440 RepID=A0A0C3FQB2_PILCF|nr:glycoside hydrolase family 13 protein [Piloderma croceum F 1598]